MIELTSMLSYVFLDTAYILRLTKILPVNRVRLLLTGLRDARVQNSTADAQAEDSDIPFEEVRVFRGDLEYRSNEKTLGGLSGLGSPWSRFGEKHSHI
jgi:hypothetical protein